MRFNELLQLKTLCTLRFWMFVYWRDLIETEYLKPHYFISTVPDDTTVLTDCMSDLLHSQYIYVKSRHFFLTKWYDRFSMTWVSTSQRFCYSQKDNTIIRSYHNSLWLNIKETRRATLSANNHCLHRHFIRIPWTHLGQKNTSMTFAYQSIHENVAWS